MASNSDPLCALLVISLLPLWNATMARARELNGAACSLDSGIDTKPPPVLSVHASLSLREFYKLSQSFKTLKSQLGAGTTERESKDCMGDGRTWSHFSTICDSCVFAAADFIWNFPFWSADRRSDAATERLPKMTFHAVIRPIHFPYRAIASQWIGTLPDDRSMKRLAVCSL